LTDAGSTPAISTKYKEKGLPHKAALFLCIDVVS